MRINPSSVLAAGVVVLFVLSGVAIDHLEGTLADTSLPASLRSSDRRLSSLGTSNATAPEAALHERCSNFAPSPPFGGNNQVRKPMWVASFPGSGSELFRNLVEAATGLPTDEVYNRDSDCQHNPVICKTHWPMKVGGSALKWGAVPEDRRDHFQQRAVVLLRNPAHAIPSLFNYKWEEQHHIRGHSQQGSEDDWIEWRDRRFDNTLAAWKKLLLTWAKQVSYDAALFVPYEELTEEETGPGLLKDLVEELADGGSPVIPLWEVPCVWQQVVQGKASQKRRHRDYQPRFTEGQKSQLLAALSELLTELQDIPQVVDILMSYLHEIEFHLPLQDSPAMVI